jgi:5-methyltetrahydrofolate--homocysteine methyltransferase
MKRADFHQLLSERTLVCDGPLGHLLGARSAGAKAVVPARPDLLALEDADRLAAVHRGSLEAGADVILTNTLTANGPTLESVALQDRLSEMIARSVAIARDVVATHTRPGDRPRLVAFALGPLAPGIAPLGRLTFARAVEAYAEVVRFAAGGGLDLFFLDGHADLQSLRAALIAIREEAPDYPVVATLAFGADGRAEGGTSPAALVAVARSLGADVVGACGSVGPDRMMPVAKALRTVSDLPLILAPAVGEPDAQEPSLGPREFVRRMGPLLEGGVGLTCCWGAPAPQYTALLARQAHAVVPELPPRVQRLVVASRRRDIEIGGGRGLVAVQAWGAPARRAWQESAAGRRDAWRHLGDRISRSAVAMIEVRLPTPGLDEPGFFAAAVPELTAASDCPLLITADTRKGLETALQHAAGRPLVAGVWADRSRLDRVLPLARRYGAAVVATCMTGREVPRRAEQKLEIAEMLLGEAAAAGLAQEDLIIDPALGSVLADTSGPRELVRALALLKERLGQPAMLRLGRIAEGLPAGRVGVEMAMLAMAGAGQVDLVVGDFDVPPLRQAAAAASLLMGRDRQGRRYQQIVGGSERDTPRSPGSARPQRPPRRRPPR